MGRLFSALLFVALLCSAAPGAVVYTTSDGGAGSVGYIDGELNLSSGVLSGLGGDTVAFAYRHGSQTRILIDERGGGADDRVSVYAPGHGGWSAPIASGAWEGASGILQTAVSRNDRSLFAACRDSARIVEIDTGSYGPKNSYALPESEVSADYTARPGGVHIMDNIVYVLFTFSDSAGAAWQPSRIVYLDGRLEPYHIDDDVLDARVGPNVSGMVEFIDRSIAVSYRGGRQPAGTSGGIDLLYTRRNEVVSIVSGDTVGAVEALCPDGDRGLYFVGQRYMPDDAGGVAVPPRSTLYYWEGSSGVRTVRDISSVPGAPYQLAWDEESETLVVLAGDRILFLDAAGEVKKQFSSAELGGTPHSIALASLSDDDDDDSGNSSCNAAGAGTLALLLSPLFLVRRKARP